MKKMLAFALLCALLSGAAAAETAVFPDDPDALSLAAASVVQLEVYGADGGLITRGSGFAAFSDRVLVTCGHVVTGMDRIVALTEDGRRIPVDQLLAVDEDSDAALCLLPEDANLAPLPCAETMPRRGERVVAIGSAFGILNLVTKGDLCGVWDSGGLSWLLFSAPVSSGVSGGALLNSDGNVIGIIMGTYDDAQALNLATPIAAARNLFHQLEDGILP